MRPMPGLKIRPTCVTQVGSGVTVKSRLSESANSTPPHQSPAGRRTLRPYPRLALMRRCDPFTGTIDIGPVERGHRFAADQSQRARHLRAKDLDGARNPSFACRAETPRVGTTDQHGTCAETQRFDHVAAASNAAVHQHLAASACDTDDLREGAYARGCAVELPAAMVRHDDGIGTFIEGPPRIVTGQDALDHERSAPRVANPGQVPPRDR